MTITYFPFNEGAGANSYQDRWSKMARLWTANDGVVADSDDDLELRVYADSTGMQVKVTPGTCWIKGHRYENDALATLAIAAAHPTLGRIDAVIGEVDWTAYTMSVKVLTGTAAASPAAPSLTQSGSKWQIKLAQVTVDAAAVTIAAGKVADYRPWALGQFSIPIRLGNGVAVPSTGAMPVAIYIPRKCKIRAWSIVADASGSIVVDLWRDVLANYPPTVADTIVSSGKPTLSSARTASASPTNTTWPNRVLLAGHYLLPNIDSVSTVKMVMLSLLCSNLQE